MIGKAASEILIRIKGDSSQFKKELDKSETDLDNFASHAKASYIAAGIGIAGAAAGVVAQSVKMAAAEEVVSRQTEALLKSQGVYWNSVSDEFDKYMKKLEKLTAYNDTDLQKAFNTMIASGMSYTEAMDSMNTVTSMAYTRGTDLVTMANLIGKAYNGMTGELTRHGIVLGDNVKAGQEVAAIQEYVSKNFADATARADTYEGQMETLTNQMSNFAEALGTEVLPTLTDVTKGMNEAGESGKNLGTRLGEGISWGLEHALPADVLLASKLNKMKRDYLQTQADIITASRKSSLAVIEPLDQDEWKKIANLGIEYNTLNDILNVKKQIHDINVADTKETEKQLSLMQKFSAHQKTRTRIGNLDLSSLGAFGTTRQSGAFTIRKATEAEMSGSRSGL